jgi:hypothetical protein
MAVELFEHCFKISALWMTSLLVSSFMAFVAILTTPRTMEGRHDQDTSNQRREFGGVEVRTGEVRTFLSLGARANHYVSATQAC